jgi:hypothetical protein
LLTVMLNAGSETEVLEVLALMTMSLSLPTILAAGNPCRTPVDLLKTPQAGSFVMLKVTLAPLGSLTFGANQYPLPPTVTAVGGLPLMLSVLALVAAEAIVVRNSALSPSVLVRRITFAALRDMRSTPVSSSSTTPGSTFSSPPESRQTMAPGDGECPTLSLDARRHPLPHAVVRPRRLCVPALRRGFASCNAEGKQAGPRGKYRVAAQCATRLKRATAMRARRRRSTTNSTAALRAAA